MIIMMAFMFKWKNHHEAPQVMVGLSLENLIMFSLSTPVQVRSLVSLSDSSYCLFAVDQWSVLLRASIQSLEASVGEHGRLDRDGDNDGLCLLVHRCSVQHGPATSQSDHLLRRATDADDVRRSRPMARAYSQGSLMEQRCQLSEHPDLLLLLRFRAKHPRR